MEITSAVDAKLQLFATLKGNRYGADGCAPAPNQVFYPRAGPAPADGVAVGGSPESVVRAAALGLRCAGDTVDPSDQGYADLYRRCRSGSKSRLSERVH